MKKLFLMSVVLLMAVMAQAQIKVSPKMQKGDVKTYVEKATIDIPGQATLNVESESVYKVVDATADGFVVSMATTKVENDAAADNIIGRLMALSSQVLSGQTLTVVTDKEGKPLQLKNYDEVKKNVEQLASKFVDELMEQVPQMKDMMSKETIMQQVMDGVTEESLLASMQRSTGIFALNGKTISMGAQDEYTNEQGMTMKRMYLVSGNNKITTTANLDSSPETMKKTIIAQVEKMAPDQAEMIKQNIDAVIASGMIKLESTEKTIYELAADGWVKSIDMESTTGSMGQNVKTKVTINQK
ncbi:MAG: hypothetical protein IJ612_00905 [Prevotella sp.]|nr:hypothetical protein [Prevotella sp.]